MATCQSVVVKTFAWNNKKSDQLKRNRGVSFEEVTFHVTHGGLLDIVDQPNQLKYPGQRVFVVMETEKKKARKAALRTLKKQRLHIEISSNDFVLVQKRAIKEGVRSDALISKVVHQYVSGQLIDKKDQ